MRYLPLAACIIIKHQARPSSKQYELHAMPSSFWLDSHVHIQSSAELDEMLDSAYSNLNRFCGKSSSSDQFVVCLQALAGQNLSEMIMLGSEARKWQLSRQTGGLVARLDGREITLLLGEQLVSSEGIEVLVIGEPPFLRDTQANAAQILSSVQHGIAILPWGFGKWLGKRGRTVSKMLVEEPPLCGLFIGDIPARTALLGGSSQLATAQKNNIPLLRGTDPLPLSGEVQRVGLYGSRIIADLQFSEQESSPERALKALQRLVQPQESGSIKLEQFGNRLPLIANLRSQIQLRIK